MNKHQKNKNEILKEQCFIYLNGKKCYVCNTSSLPSVCYDFHHYKNIKEQEISKMIQRKHKLDEELKKELDKCKVICSNCHRQVTARIIVIH